MDQISNGLNPEVQTLLQKIKQNAPVTIREVALVIANHEESLLKFICDNDPVQVHKLLHESGAPLLIGKNASFVPNYKRCSGELKLLLGKRDYVVLNQVVSGFVLNLNIDNYTTNPGLLKELEIMKVIVPTANGYMFNVILS